MLSAFKKLLNRLTTSARRGEPVIRLVEGGFMVVQGNQTLVQARWSDVKEIVAFKLDLLTTDCVCLGLRVTDAGDYYKVNEEMPGYSDLVEEMQRLFPDYNKEWWLQVAFPAFATNLTPVWGDPWAGPACGSPSTSG